MRRHVLALAAQACPTVGMLADMPAQQPAEAPAPWREVVPSACVDLWDALPQVTVLAVTPGWGRSTWMRQCAAHIRSTRSDADTIWIRSRGDANHLLAPAPPPDRPQFLFIDDVLYTVDDPLWSALFDRASSTAHTQVIVSSLDRAQVHGTDVEIMYLHDRDWPCAPRTCTNWWTSTPPEPRRIFVLPW